MTNIQKKHIVLVAAILLGLLALFMILHAESITAWLDYVMFVLRPVLIGLVLAYLCNPLFRLFEYKLFFGIRLKGFRRALSLLMTYIVLALIFVTLFLLIVPQLISSILDFFGNYQTYLRDALASINGIIDFINQAFGAEITYLEYESILHTVSDFLHNIEIQSFLEGLLSFSTISILLTTLGDVFFIFTDIIFGVFISLYILNSKEKRYAQVMRLRKAIFSDKMNEIITSICTTADRSFGGFIRGKMLDSTIVGILVYIIISLMNVPYSLLIAVIIGITDFVPVIGPFIGVIPSAVIILLTDPIKVIPFLLCILIVQQIDGNIIAPKILGDNIGVSSLCVLIAITVMGAIWGLAGMVLGVPLFATILDLSSRYLEKRLQEKGLYVGRKPVGEDDNNVSRKKKKQTARPRLHLKESESGKGSLTDLEAEGLRLYSIAKRHGLFTDRNAETLARFSDEIRPENTEVTEDTLDQPDPLQN